MAINQVSLFFYPPRWRQRLTEDPTALTDEGTPLRIAEAVPAASGHARPVAGDELKRWLSGHGFTQANWGDGGIFERGRVLSLFGFEKEIQINLGEQAGEVVELYCRFTLPRRDPPPLNEWAAFVASLGEAFSLHLASQPGEPCTAAAFTAAVAVDRNYHDFAAGRGCEPRRGGRM